MKAILRFAQQSGNLRRLLLKCLSTLAALLYGSQKATGVRRRKHRGLPSAQYHGGQGRERDDARQVTQARRLVFGSIPRRARPGTTITTGNTSSEACLQLNTTEGTAGTKLTLVAERRSKLRLGDVDRLKVLTGPRTYRSEVARETSAPWHWAHNLLAPCSVYRLRSSVKYTR